MRKFYAGVMLCIISVTAVQAQDSLKTTVLDEVVTTATRYEQHVMETPRSVSVITKDAIEKGVYNSVGELLSSQGGMYIVGANQTPGSTQSLFMRGAGSQQVAVLIDGTRITDPSSPSGTIDLNELSVTDVERIEIIRGSHSSVYGGAAVGGVVNIITKKGGRPGFNGHAKIQGATFGNSTLAASQNIGLNYTWQNGIYINGALMNQNVRGMNASIDTVANAILPSDKDNFNKTDVYIKAGFKNTAWKGFISYKKTNQRADIDEGVFDDDDNAYLDFDRHWIDYQLAYQLSTRWNITALGSWSDSERRSVNDSSVVDADGNYNSTYVEGTYRGRIMTNEIQANYQSTNLNGVIGVGQYAEDMNFNTYYFSNSSFGVFESRVNYDSLDTSAKTNYVFGNLTLSLDRFNFSLGSRLSNHSLFGNHITFEASPSYYFNSASLYASISTGFNPASLYQLYDPTQGFSAYTTRGNKNLKPEESLSLEVGMKKEFANGSYLTLSAYRTETKNAIEYIYLWNKNTPINDLSFADNLGDTYLNIAKQIVNGLEVEGRVLFGKFEIKGNLTLLKGNIEIDPANITDGETGGHHVQLFNYGSFVNSKVEIDKLVRRPTFTSFTNFTYSPIASVSLSATYRYAGSRWDSGYDENLGPYGALNQFRLASYHLIDFGVGWGVTKSIGLAVKIENIMDTQYQEIIGFQTRGRSAYLSLSFRW